MNIWCEKYIRNVEMFTLQNMMKYNKNTSTESSKKYMEIKQKFIMMIPSNYYAFKGNTCIEPLIAVVCFD